MRHMKFRAAALPVACSLLCPAAPVGAPQGLHSTRSQDTRPVSEKRVQVSATSIRGTLAQSTATSSRPASLRLQVVARRDSDHRSATSWRGCSHLHAHRSTTGDVSWPAGRTIQKPVSSWASWLHILAHSFCASWNVRKNFSIRTIHATSRCLIASCCCIKNNEFQFA
jgi:hypothetical protein